MREDIFKYGDSAEHTAAGAASVVDLREMHSVVAVANDLHFTRAAEKLHLAQSALSRQIQQLELALGVELFRRDRRRVELTQAGGVFVEHARKSTASADGDTKDSGRIARRANCDHC
jgi:DNA-binding transcriptional LysR family regulator